MGEAAPLNRTQNILNTENSGRYRSQGGEGIVSRQAIFDRPSNALRKISALLQAITGQGDVDAGVTQAASIGRGCLPVPERREAYGKRVLRVGYVRRRRKIDGQNQRNPETGDTLQLAILITAAAHGDAQAELVSKLAGDTEPSFVADLQDDQIAILHSTVDGATESGEGVDGLRRGPGCLWFCVHSGVPTRHPSASVM